jgi:hypothetical protein
MIALKRMARRQTVREACAGAQPRSDHLPACPLRARSEWAGGDQRRSMDLARPCPQDAPEPPSTADDHHHQHPVNLMPARPLNPYAMHETGS